MAWAPDYVTAAELKAFKRIGDTDDDVQVAVAVTAASRAIDQHCNRQFGQVAAAEERLYTGRYDYDRGRWVVDIDDLQSTTNFAADIDGTAIDDYTLEPVNAAQRGTVWTRFMVGTGSAATPCGDPHEVAVTALWGWTAVPTAVKQAALLQASRFLSRRDSPYGVAGSPDLGSELRLLSKVDADVAVSLRAYVRRRVMG